MDPLNLNADEEQEYIEPTEEELLRDGITADEYYAAFYAKRGGARKVIANTAQKRTLLYSAMPEYRQISATGTKRDFKEFWHSMEERWSKMLVEEAEASGRRLNVLNDDDRKAIKKWFSNHRDDPNIIAVSQIAARALKPIPTQVLTHWQSYLAMFWDTKYRAVVNDRFPKYVLEAVTRGDEHIDSRLTFTRKLLTEELAKESDEVKAMVDRNRHQLQSVVPDYLTELQDSEDLSTGPVA